MAPQGLVAHQPILENGEIDHTTPGWTGRKKNHPSPPPPPSFSHPSSLSLGYMADTNTYNPPSWETNCHLKLSRPRFLAPPQSHHHTRSYQILALPWGGGNEVKTKLVVFVSEECRKKLCRVTVWERPRHLDPELELLSPSGADPFPLPWVKKEEIWFQWSRNPPEEKNTYIFATPNLSSHVFSLRGNGLPVCGGCWDPLLKCYIYFGSLLTTDIDSHRGMTFKTAKRKWIETPTII